MFKPICLWVAMCVALAIAEPEQIYDRYGREFYLIPTEEYHQIRYRRDTRIVPDNNIRGKLYGREDAQYGEVYGGKATYTHRPSDTQVSVQGERRQRGGSEVSATGKYNFFKTDDGRGTIGAGGKYSRQHDGYGNRKDDYSAIIEGEYRF